MPELTIPGMVLTEDSSRTVRATRNEGTRSGNGKIIKPLSMKQTVNRKKWEN